MLFTADDNNDKITENIVSPGGKIVASGRFDSYFNGNMFFFHQDIRNSTTAIINHEATAMKYYEYDEKGNAEEKGNDSFINENTFTGAISEGDGIYYMNARFYDSNTGRFLSQDSYTGNAYEPWSQHLYSYCGNNPVNMIDPTGHWAQGTSSTAGVPSDVYNKHSEYFERNEAVIFYEPGDSYWDAKDEVKYLESMGYNATMVEVTNGNQFETEWNNLSAYVAHVTIISHASPWSLSFDKSSTVGVSVLNSTYNANDSRATDDVYVEQLDTKDVNLRIVGCNTGHKDVTDNLAYGFSMITSGDIYACDGNMKSGWWIFNANHGETWGGSGRGSFKYYCINYGTGIRKPAGLYKYR